MPFSLETIQHHLDQLTKPPGSLGRLEELAARLCQIQQTLTPRTRPRRLVVFAADHGVVASGVSAWPSEVTGLMIRNILSGGAASSVLADSTQTELALVNMGTISGDPLTTPAVPERGEDRKRGRGEEEQRGGMDCFVAPPLFPSSPLPLFSFSPLPVFSPSPRPLVRTPTPSPHLPVYHHRPIRPGTGNLAVQPAMTLAEFEQALRAGRDEARQAAEKGAVVVAAGEMGIGNSTAAAALAMLLADLPVEQAVGRGAGADEEILERKRTVVETAVARARRSHADPQSRMAEVAGLELVAMAGFFMEAYAAGLTIILDGYIAGAAALMAETLEPGMIRSMIASHLSAEPGHQRVLEHLGLSPFLDWELRLGEGTGALLLMPLLDAAAAMMTRMATFQDLGIAREGTTQRGSPTSDGFTEAQRITEKN